jgi:serine/threonine protein kinase
MSIDTGHLVGERYRLTRKIGEGGFGEIFIAEDTLQFNTECIVKFFVQRHAEDSPKGQKARSLFESEARILYQLKDYPQVPKLLAFLPVEGCIVQELVDGNDLSDAVEDRAFDEDEVLDLLTQILPILKEIHDQGIFHRDITPGNILKRHRNNEFVLIDFGISKEIQESNSSTESPKHLGPLVSTNFGTPGYHSPDMHHSAASDLYSLGATCYYLLTKHDPDYFNEGLWINVDMVVGKETAAIIKKLFTEDLSSRYQNAEHVLHDIRQLESVKRNDKIIFLMSLLEKPEYGL